MSSSLIRKNLLVNRISLNKILRETHLANKQHSRRTKMANRLMWKSLLVKGVFSIKLRSETDKTNQRHRIRTKMASHMIYQSLPMANKLCKMDRIMKSTNSHSSPRHMDWSQPRTRPAASLKLKLSKRSPRRHLPCNWRIALKMTMVWSSWRPSSLMRSNLALLFATRRCRRIASRSFLQKSNRSHPTMLLSMLARILMSRYKRTNRMARSPWTWLHIAWSQMRTTRRRWTWVMQLLTVRSRTRHLRHKRRWETLSKGLSKSRSKEWTWASRIALQSSKNWRI